MGAVKFGDCFVVVFWWKLCLHSVLLFSLTNRQDFITVICTLEELDCCVFIVRYFESSLNC